MKKIIIILILIAICGCGTINGIISPEQQCSLLKSGGRMGIAYIKDAKINEASYNIIKTQIMPRLSNKKAEEISHADLDKLLVVINAKLDYRTKVTIQSGVNTILAWTPSIKKSEAKTSAWSQLIENLKCLFQGVLDGFASSQMSIKTKTISIGNPDFKVKWKK